MDKITTALEKCRIFGPLYHREIFDKIYPFTTENISGYIDLFDLEDKTLLTIGSSSDQVINAIYRGCQDITLLDICPYTEDYFYLKSSAIEELDYEEFLKFLCYKSFLLSCFDNHKVLNKQSFEKLSPTLSKNSKESFLLWSSLLSKYKGTRIRQRMFMPDEESIYAIINCNSYLKNESTYLETREKLQSSKVNILQGDITKMPIPNKFDNIWLSNLPAYLPFEEIKKLFEKMQNYLNDDGKMLFSYLYGITSETTYEPEWSEIYNLEKITSQISKELQLLSFIGIKGIEEGNSLKQDSILVYQKRK